MSNSLKEAIERAEQLPAQDQDEIGRTVLSYIERMEQLRAEIDQGIASLDAGQGDEFDLRGFIHSRYGAA